MVTCFIDKHRHLVIRGDVVPFDIKAMFLKFSCENIKKIGMAKDANLLVIETSFGQTGVMVPLTGV
jgi:hypothetical protein